MFFKNQKGVALVYVLMSLVFVGAIGILILNIATKEMTDTSLRASTETTRFSANAGLTEAVNIFTDTTNSALEKKALNYLKHWYDNYKTGGDISNIQKQYKWIIGDSTTFADTNGMKYRVEIVNIDFSEVKQITDSVGNLITSPKLMSPEDSPVIVSLRSESIDSTGSRSVSEGSYRIIGFEDKKVPIRTITHALYLGGGSILINCDVDINGDTYIGGQNSSKPAIQHTQPSPNSDQISHYRGEFRLYGNDTQIPLLVNERFHGPAYFEGGTIDFSLYPTTTQYSNFYKGWGGSNITFTNSNSNAIMKTRDDGQENLAVFSNDVTYNDSRITLETNTRIEEVNSKEEVFEKLAMDPTEPSNFEIVLSDKIIDKKYILPSPSYSAATPLTGPKMQSLYDGNTADKYIDDDGNKWLVLETGAESQLGSSGTFNGNAIIINRHGTSGHTTLGIPSTSSDGVIVFFVPPNAEDAPTEKMKTIAPNPGNYNYGYQTGTFNGLFYNGSRTTTLTLGSGGLWTVNGAFYNIGNKGDVGNNAEIWLGGNGHNGPIVIDFNSDAAKMALEKIQNLGVVVWKGDGYTEPDFQRIPETVSPKPTSTLQSRSF